MAFGGDLENNTVSVITGAKFGLNKVNLIEAVEMAGFEVEHDDTELDDCLEVVCDFLLNQQITANSEFKIWFDEA